MASVLIFIAAIILTFSIVFSIIGKDSVFRKRPLLTLSIGVFISSMLMFIPVYRDFFSNNILGMIETIIMSIHNTIRLFVVDADYEIISIFVDDLNLTTKLIYQVVSTICYIFAPLLTFSFVVSFFKNINAYLKINLSNYHEIYIFSNINEKALVLASDIKNKKENGKKRILLLFCDIENDQQKNDMLDEIKMLKAIVLEKSIENINIKYINKKTKITYVFLPEDIKKEGEIITKISTVFNNYKKRENTNMYIFSKTKSTELFLGNILDDYSVDKNNTEKYYQDIETIYQDKMKIVRVNEIKYMIYQYFYKSGNEIFDGAINKGDHRLISAVVVGMGAYGTEFAKTLSWYSQMNGYRLLMNCFDESVFAFDVFKEQCPELLNPKFKNDIKGESQYEINVNSGINVNGYSFEEYMNNIGEISVIFVALGSDENNIQTALKMRMIAERMKINPKIISIVYNDNLCESVKDSKIRGKRYNIEFIGNRKSIFSYDTIINNELISGGEAIHLKYSNIPHSEEKYALQLQELIKETKEQISSTKDEKMKEILTKKCADYQEKLDHHKAIYQLALKNYYFNEYNYYSSISSYIHFNVRKKYQKGCSNEEICCNEHRRWNAYTRSLGYIYDVNRNDLGKIHHELVPYYQLSIERRKIDEEVIND